MAVCITCTAEFADERKSLGYDYCTSADCGRVNYRGKVIAEIAINKAAPAFTVLDEETLEKAKRGEFGKRHNRVIVAGGGGSVIHTPRVPVRVAQSAPRKKAWTEQQEQFVKANIAMGLRPAQIVEKDRTGKLTTWLVTQIALSKGK